MPNAAPVYPPRPHAARAAATLARRPSAAKRGYGGKSWEYKRRETFLADQYLCRQCGTLCVEMSDDWRRRPHCDHIIPTRHGGTDEPGNRQTLCGSCHNCKTGRDRRGGGIK
jgi:5-methylcytosine-specific restriction endonuclease McrA